MTVQWVPTRRLADVRTGKIVNDEPSSAIAIEAPYVTAANVQPLGRVIEVEGKTMWFEPKELAGPCGIRGGDLLVVEGGAGFGRPGIVPDEFDGWGFQNHINRIRPREDLADARFLYYAFEHLLSSGETAVVAQGATLPTLSSEKVRSLRVPHWALELQRDIADFLDRETAQIDATIDAQQRLIDLLTERRTAMLESFTGSTRPDSGGGTPGRRLWSEVDIRAGESDLPLLSVSIHSGVQRRDSLTDDVPRAEDLSNYKIARAGDIVINRMRAFQGALGLVHDDGVVSPDYLVLRPVPSVSAEWLTHVLKSPWFVGEMTARIRGIGSTDSGAVRTPRINPSDIGAICLACPPLAEQQRAVREVLRATARLDALLNVARRSVDLLRERRAALITAAVTGRIDPRTGVERLDEVMEGAAS